MSQTLYLVGAALASFVISGPALAQDDEGETKRTRIALGPQLVPSWPGASDTSWRPLTDISTARGDQPFAFEAPDESFDISLYGGNGFAFGPVLNFEGERSSEDVGGNLPKVDFSFEIGGFVNYNFTDNLRLRGEVRKAVSGHDGLIAVLGGDYVIRDADEYLLSIGPRVTITDSNFQDAYFGVTPADALASGLPAYDPGSGLQSYGVTVGYIQQFSENWGLYSYAKYDRLVDDVANSPIIQAYGSRDQFSGGVALSYTFDGGIF